MNVDKPKLGYFDLQNDAVYGIICSDNANSDYNIVSREENSFELNCQSTAANEK